MGSGSPRERGVGETPEERTTRSGLPLKEVYTAADDGGADWDPGLPGRPPYTRGVTARGYRDKPWVMGQYGGFGSAEETNVRFRELLRQGQTGFSVALDLPTQMGLDSDDPMAAGEVGRVGVPIDSLADLETLFDGIPLSEIRQIRTTANSIGPLWLALVVALARKQGQDPSDIAIFIQNDVLKEYIARGTQIFDPAAGLELSAQTVAYTARHLKSWTPLAISGYHIRETGATAAQELAFTLANAIAYLDDVRDKGVPVDDFAGKLFMFLSAGMDLLEEVAKFRAARTVWSELLSERYGASEAAQALNIFSYTAGSSLGAQSPHINIVRVTIEALAAVLGGVQTLNTSSYDEALGTPTLEAVTLALRTQQVVLEESGVAATADPLGGSWAVESLTRDIVRQVHEQLEIIARKGGALACIENGYFTSVLEGQAYESQLDIESGRRRVVGLNCYQDESSVEVPAFTVDPAAESAQLGRLAEVRDRRSAAEVDRTLRALEEAARTGAAVIEPMIDAVAAYATVGEIYGRLARVYGRYSAPSGLSGR
ncbi:hypothetical protein PZ61_0235915 [Streptomyces sp. MNU77]|nr:hypothetical protein PZ61_0235915 [Streptomyces sp. MNU77]